MAVGLLALAVCGAARALDPATQTAPASQPIPATRTAPASAPVSAPATVPAQPAAQKMALGLRLDKGSAYEVETTTAVDLLQVMQKAGIKVTQKTSTTARARYVVENVVDGVMTIRVTYLGMGMEIETPTLKVKGDSSDPAGKNNIDKVCLSVVGKSFTIDIDWQGVIKKVTGSKEFAEAAADAMSKEAPANRAAVLAQLQALFSENALAQQFGAAFRVFPFAPVAVMEAWKIQVPMQFGSTTASTTTYWITGVKDQVASVSLDGIASSPEGGIKGTASGMATVSKIGGTIKGNIQLNVVTGLFNSYTTDTDTSGIVALTSADGKTTEDVFTHVHTVSTVTMKSAR